MTELRPEEPGLLCEEEPTEPAPEELKCLTQEELAELLQVSPSALARMRALKNQGGPPWIKIGRLVRYRTADVLEWQKENASNQPC